MEGTRCENRRSKTSMFSNFLHLKEEQRIRTKSVEWVIKLISKWLSLIIQAFINRSKKAGFCNTELDDFALLCAKADKDLFTKVLNSPDHVLHPLLPPPMQQNYNLRNRPHNRQLPERSFRLVDCNFIIRMLYHNMYWLLHHFISFYSILSTCLEMRSVIS